MPSHAGGRGRVGALTGGLIGSAIGSVVASLGANKDWCFALALLGVFDGGGTALIYSTCLDDGAEAAHKRLAPHLLALVYFIIGLKCGRVESGLNALPAAILCGAANSVIGLVTSKLCYQRIRLAARHGQVGVPNSPQPQCLASLPDRLDVEERP